MVCLQETPHVYEVKVYNNYPPADRDHLPPDRMVTMQRAPGAEDVDLPNPVLLECHYRVAEILNASGMAEVIEQKINEWENVKEYEGGGCLNGDGTTDVFRFLSAGLWESVVG